MLLTRECQGQSQGSCSISTADITQFQQGGEGLVCQHERTPERKSLDEEVRQVLCIEHFVHLHGIAADD